MKEIPRTNAQGYKWKLRDFGLGLIGSLVINGIVLVGLTLLLNLLLILFVSPETPGATLDAYAYCIVCPPLSLAMFLNAVAIALVIDKHRPGFLLGILASYALGFLVFLLFNLILILFVA